MYGGLRVGELRRLKLLEEEDRKLKQLVADQGFDKHILQDVLGVQSRHLVDRVDDEPVWL